MVHVLVLTAFTGPPPAPRSQTRHLDGNHRNNIPSNLEWGTAVQNGADRERHGTALFGERHPRARWTDNDVREMRRLAASGVGATEIAARFGTTEGSIGRIVRRKAWPHVV